MGKPFFRFIILITGLLSLLAYAWPVQAQTPTPRDELIKSIQVRAQQDVELGLPHQTPSDLGVLFREDASSLGLSMNEVVGIYSDAYELAQKARSPQDQLKDLIQPNIGWVVAAVLFAILILRDVIKDYLTRLFKWVIEGTYQKMAGLRPFWAFSLRRYRKALEHTYQQIKNAFRPDQPLNIQDIYVPVRVAGSTSRHPLDAYQVIQNDSNKHTVVVGTPGSGKTILLRHLALMFARQGLRDFPERPIPVLLELNRLNSSELPLIDHLVEVLDRSDFPGASGFIKSFLEKGQLLLLLDGLDEVNSAVRPQVVAQINDLLEKYRDTRVIITCRTQAYREEYFIHQLDKKLEIVEFDDQQIQRFIGAWQMSMKEGKSIEHLLQKLQERPQLMTLARNPLLLTIIAYLYTDAAFVLPHSRAEFYEQATNFLLDRWKGTANHYKAFHKRLILQSLALFNHSGRADPDKITMEFSITIDQIHAVLPNLHLKEENAQSILDEIVERSGLLISLDNGERFQFAHLSLQEFFAAQALKSDPQKLLIYFRSDNDAWREAVRFWCGLEHDSTDLIREIIADGQGVLAFECLAEAQIVEPTYANRLIDLFHDHLGDVLNNNALAHAFALMASVENSRGTMLFNYLKKDLENPRTQLAAATVLSLTNSQKAAQVLVQFANEVPELRYYLYDLGDIAVPFLKAKIEQGQDWVFDVLGGIGTPSAALALVKYLWDENDKTAYLVAWLFATLLHKPNVELALRVINLDSKQQKAKQINWVWDPFGEPSSSAIPVIAGRCVYLLLHTPNELLPGHMQYGTTFDPRLAIPAVVQEAIENPDAKYLLLNGISSRLHTRLTKILKPERYKKKPTINDWLNIFRVERYDFEDSLQAGYTKTLLILLGILNIIEAGGRIAFSAGFWKWETLGLSLWGVLMIMSIWYLLRYPIFKASELLSETFTKMFKAMGQTIFRIIGIPLVIALILSVFLFPFAAIAYFSIKLRVAGVDVSLSLIISVIAVFLLYFLFGKIENWWEHIAGSIPPLTRMKQAISEYVLPIAFLLFLIVLIGYLPTQLLYAWWNLAGPVLFWLMWGSCAGLIAWYSIWKTRRSENPLDGLLNTWDME